VSFDLSTFELIAFVAAGATIATAFIAFVNSLRKRVNRTRGRVRLLSVDPVPHRPPHGNEVYVRMQIENPAKGTGDQAEALSGIRFRVVLRQGKKTHMCRVISIVPAEGPENDSTIHALGRLPDGEADFAVPIPGGSRFTFDLRVRIPRDVDGDVLIVNLLDTEGSVKRDSIEIPWKPFVKKIAELEV